jgi:hypothetical protein
MEREIADLDARARVDLSALTKLCGAAGEAHLASAASELDRFRDLGAQIVRLSRRNTNVHSLRLVLQEKPPILAKCDEALQRLQRALASADFGPKR